MGSTLTSVVYIFSCFDIICTFDYICGDLELILTFLKIRTPEKFAVKPQI